MVDWRKKIISEAFSGKDIPQKNKPETVQSAVPVEATDAQLETLKKELISGLKDEVVKEIKDGKTLSALDLKDGQSIVYPNKKVQDLRFHGAGVTKIIAGNNITISSPDPGGSGLGDVTINASVVAGVDSINGDSTSAQTLTVGTSGTDFAIVDNGVGDHKFNLPTASAVNRGALSSADWTTFNNKLANAVTSINADTTAAQTFAVGTTGADFNISDGGGGAHTLNLPVASSVNTGKLTNTDWTTFNNKVSETGSVVATEIPTYNDVTGKVITGSNVFLDASQNMTNLQTIQTKNNGGLRAIQGDGNQFLIQSYDDGAAAFINMITVINGPIGRIMYRGGAAADIVAAGDLVLGQAGIMDGNFVKVTGSTQINAIRSNLVFAGTRMTLWFAAAPLVKHNTAGGADTSPILLASSVDFQAAANSILEIVFDGTNWQELSRKVA